MKTLDQRPLWYGGALARAERQQARRERSAAAAQMLCNAVLKWVLWPLILLVLALIVGAALTGAALRFLTR